MTKKCDGNCCNDCLSDYNAVEDDYEIQRLKDIIEICEYLIQVRTHKIEKQRIVNDLLDNEDEKEKKDDEARIIHHVYPYRYYTNNKYNPNPWWDIWF